MAADAGAALLLVVGSVNADIYIELERLPLKGETISAKDDSGFMLPGGKGANQVRGSAARRGACSA
jgi:ribokinase